MSTFVAADHDVCVNCGAPDIAHEVVTDECPRAVSQPLSRVVAGPNAQPEGCPGCFICDGSLLEAARMLREPKDFAEVVDAINSIQATAGRIDARRP